MFFEKKLFKPKNPTKKNQKSLLKFSDFWFYITHNDNYLHHNKEIKFFPIVVYKHAAYYCF